MKQKLVTIAVTTYNSERYLLETLESIYNQDYNNLELIISDDFSTDNTMAIANEWIKDEKIRTRFHSIEVITVPQNTGVSANCNRCISHANSDWIKFIAGDDILLPECISSNMDFVKDTPNAKIVFSQVKIYRESISDNSLVEITPQDYPKNIMGPGYSAADQFVLLLISDRIHYTPSYFFNKTAITAVGGYDESNKLVEDYPMWLKLTKSGEKLHYFHKPTVGYRRHGSALNNIEVNSLFPPSALRNFDIRKKMVHPYLPWEIVMMEYFRHSINYIFLNLRLNRKSVLLKAIYHIWTTYLNPFFYVYVFKKKFVVKSSVFYNQ